MAAAEAAAAAGGELPEDDGEEELVGPQLPEAAPGDRGNWGGALRPGVLPYAMSSAFHHVVP